MTTYTDTARVQCVILAGGLGSRLRGAVPDRPKILAPIDDRPFIDYLIDWLMGQGIRRLVFSLGYKAEMIQAYLSVNRNPEFEIKSVVEPEPLGTAGGLILACSEIDSDPVLVLNGDSLIDIDLSAFLAAHRSKGADVSIVTVQVADAGRFGRVEIDADDYVRAFREKDPTGDGQTGWINAGIYAFSASALEDLRQLRQGSLEHDFFALKPARFLYAYPARGEFIDIGSPESFSHAGDWVRDNNFRSV